MKPSFAQQQKTIQVICVKSFTIYMNFATQKFKYKLFPSCLLFSFLHKSNNEIFKYLHKSQFWEFLLKACWIYGDFLHLKTAIFLILKTAFSFEHWPSAAVVYHPTSFLHKLFRYLHWKVAENFDVFSWTARCIHADFTWSRKLHSAKVAIHDLGALGLWGSWGCVAHGQ